MSYEVEILDPRAGQLLQDLAAMNIITLKEVGGNKQPDLHSYSSFSDYVPEKTAEEIIEEIKGSRHFRNKDLQL